MPVRFLIPRKEYLASGIHIGMKQKTKDMRRFIYKIRPDGLAVLNLKRVDEKIRIASKFLARQKNILVFGRKAFVHSVIKKFAEVIGAKVIVGRFMPGTLTNPKYKNFFEADVIIITDPLIDYQALEEAVKARVPVVAVCDTFNETRNVDLIIPSNNRSKRALATLFWVLSREILKERGDIKSNKDFKYKIEDFVKE